MTVTLRKNSDPGPVTIWRRSLRAYSLPVSALPPVAAFSFLRAASESVSGLDAGLYIAVAVLINAGANVLNDYYDYRLGVDDQTAAGSSGLLTDGLVEPGYFLRSGILYFSLAAVLGLFLIHRTGLYILLPFGIAAMLLAVFYTNPHFSFKYTGLGEPAVFLVSGPLLILPCGYLADGSFNGALLWFSLPFGLMTAAILLANNLRDISHDQRIGAKTLAFRLGKKHTYTVYTAMLLLSYGLWYLPVTFGMFPPAVLFTLFTLPLCLWLIRAIRRSYLRLDQATALFHLLNSLLLISGFWLPYYPH